MTIPRPESWQGPAADRMNERADGPATPALQELVGQTPLVYVARVPEAGERDEPAWELAVFDDGTLVYEGHRCIETGGVLVRRLRTGQVSGLRDALETLCPNLEEPHNQDELCDSRTVSRVVCASRDRMRVGSDHCRERYPSLGKEVDAVVAALEAHSDLASWVGQPTQRIACTPGARDLSPHDLARTIRADLADARMVSR
ncbi:MAG TPA: hypothetical protein VMT03_14065 [Polyangia bacterium]|nr:hypothetical protein [Polyangia bacterium]